MKENTPQIAEAILFAQQEDLVTKFIDRKIINQNKQESWQRDEKAKFTTSFDYNNRIINVTINEVFRRNSKLKAKIERYLKYSKEDYIRYTSKKLTWDYADKTYTFDMDEILEECHGRQIVGFNYIIDAPINVRNIRNGRISYSNEDEVHHVKLEFKDLKYDEIGTYSNGFLDRKSVV